MLSLVWAALHIWTCRAAAVSLAHRLAYLISSGLISFSVQIILQCLSRQDPAMADVDTLVEVVVGDPVLSLSARKQSSRILSKACWEICCSLYIPRI